MPELNTLLLVDDDPLQITLLSAYFAGKNIETIHTASNSARALELIDQHADNIDLIVSDIQMPEMDGIEFMRHLKTTSFAGKLALISGVKGELIEHASKLAGLHGLDLVGAIRKPVNKTDLDLLIVEHFSKSSQKNDKDEFQVTSPEIRAALDNSSFYPVYQPKVAVQSGKIIGAEALVRWTTDDGTKVAPDKFILFAEENGLIDDLTFQAFDKVLTDIDTIRSFDHAIKIAFNLPPVMINDVDLPDNLLMRMENNNVNSEQISFEVTESAILNLTPETLEVLSRLRINNFDIAVDDFGTGSANINSLVDFPYSELKIDKKYITDIANDTFSREVVIASVKLAKQQGLKIVAEGIEDRETWNIIQDLGVDYAQGYYFSRPLGLGELCKKLVEQQREAAKSNAA